jgi:hypothetical protein
VARCPSVAGAADAGQWLVDRLSRLRPTMQASVDVEPGGGQFLVVLRAGAPGGSRRN